MREMGCVCIMAQSFTLPDPSTARVNSWVVGRSSCSVSDGFLFGFVCYVMYVRVWEWDFRDTHVEGGWADASRSSGLLSCFFFPFFSPSNS